MTKVYHADQLNELKQKAADAERLRSHLNVHEALEAPVQRLFIATEPNTYMRPHRHPQSHKWEFFMVLEGKIDLMIFDDQGTLIQRTRMSPTDTRAVEIPPGTWHAYACQQSGTLALEVKEGPYIPTPEEDFASWSPAEGSEGAPAYRDWMRTAEEGTRFASE
jgi:cupin fold WbuC family metalloprotein